MSLVPNEGLYKPISVSLSSCLLALLSIASTLQSSGGKVTNNKKESENIIRSFTREKALNATWELQENSINIHWL
jgi:hypothetical protein